MTSVSHIEQKRLKFYQILYSVIYYLEILSENIGKNFALNLLLLSLTVTDRHFIHYTLQIVFETVGPNWIVPKACPTDSTLK